MDLSDSPELQQYRESVQAFLRTSLPHDWVGIGALDPDQRAEFLPRWRTVIGEHGYLGVSWPREYGGAGLSVAQQAIVQEEFVRRGVPLLPLPSDLFGFELIGPTILHRGTDEQKKHFIPRILSGNTGSPRVSPNQKPAATCSPCVPGPNSTVPSGW